jgi:hypothetical protein
VSVAHFEPVEVQVLIEGTYPMLSFNLPRIKDGAFDEALTWARNRWARLSANRFNQGCNTRLAHHLIASHFQQSDLSGCHPSWPAVPLPCLAHSSKDHELAVTVQKPLSSSQAARATAPVGGAGGSFAGIPRSSIGPSSIAGTAVSVPGRPGSGAKSQLSGMSAVSAAKSRASLASAMSASNALAKDKLSQVCQALPAFNATVVHTSVPACRQHALLQIMISIHPVCMYVQEDTVLSLPVLCFRAAAPSSPDT